ncbi:ELO family,ELO family, conserved site [Cinara cedri]|uniref:Elongation of very long chain fatty acids protein n=1 Tax=Cinara cedri TaxID=506608 RepID=A0A5E4MXE0_9HEMI|nr:ELO family,ELO family, conserved site [Cinara cedri]
MVRITMQPQPSNYSYVFDFEENFEYESTRKWMAANWTNGFYYCTIYALVVFGIRRLMRNHTGFRLKGLLILWNTMLATFSLVGFSRTAPELFRVLNKYGLHHSVCVTSYVEDDPVSGFWSWLFVLSKLPELGDTIFIVLRKQPLIFLHWYHHITVLLYTWFSYHEFTSSARWFIVMNYSVHSMMYTYYAARAMGYRPPTQISMFITASQLTQMIVGCFINYTTYGYLKAGGPQSCRVSKLNVTLSSAMYFSYFVLFAQFFYNAYILKSKGGRGGAMKKASKQH